MGANYSKNLFKQLTEQTNQIEKLEKENRTLRKENNDLRSENRHLREKIDLLETNMSQKIAIAVSETVEKAISQGYSLKAAMKRKRRAKCGRCRKKNMNIRRKSVSSRWRSTFSKKISTSVRSRMGNSVWFQKVKN